MSESLEDRVTRIADEVDCLPMKSRKQWTNEFARRLMAEQGEPVAWMNSGTIFGNKTLADRHTDRPTVPLYAAPPQDALDAKRLDMLEQLSFSDVAPYWYNGAWQDGRDNHSNSTYENLRAAIDAAMQEGNSHD